MAKNGKEIPKIVDGTAMGLGEGLVESKGFAVGQDIVDAKNGGPLLPAQQICRHGADESRGIRPADDLRDHLFSRQSKQNWPIKSAKLPEFLHQLNVVFEPFGKTNSWV